MSDVGNFELKSIRRELREDLRRYRREIGEALEQVAEDQQFAKHFDDVKRCAHAVRGVSSLVGAWALVFWCEDVEKLARYAMEKHERDAERVNLTVRFLRENHTAFEKIGNRVLNNDLDGALDIYSEIRGKMPLDLREITTERDRQSMEYASGKRTARFQHEARRQTGTRRFQDALPNPDRPISKLPPVPGAGDIPASGSEPEAQPAPSAPPEAPPTSAPGFQKPYLTEARFFLGRVEHILGTEVMPARTADLWRILARLISSLEYYLLALGNAGMLQLVDRMQQLTLRTIEDEKLRTEDTVQRLKEDHEAIEKELEQHQEVEPEEHGPTRGRSRRGEGAGGSGIVPPVPGSVPTDDASVHHLAAGNRLSNLRMLTNRFQQSRSVRNRDDNRQPRPAQHVAPEGQPPPPRDEPRIESSHPARPEGGKRRTTRVARIPVSRGAEAPPQRPRKTEPLPVDALRQSAPAQGAQPQSQAPASLPPGTAPGPGAGRIPRALRHRQILADGIKMPLSRLVPPRIPRQKADELTPEWDPDAPARGVVELKSKVPHDPEPDQDAGADLDAAPPAQPGPDSEPEPETAPQAEAVGDTIAQDSAPPETLAESEPEEPAEPVSTETASEPARVAEQTTLDLDLTEPEAEAELEPESPAMPEAPAVATTLHLPQFRPFMPLPPVHEGLEAPRTSADADDAVPEPAAPPDADNAVAVDDAPQAGQADEPDQPDEAAVPESTPDSSAPEERAEEKMGAESESEARETEGGRDEALEAPAPATSLPVSDISVGVAGEGLSLPAFLPRIPFPAAQDALTQGDPDPVVEPENNAEPSPPLPLPADLPALPAFALRMPFPMPQPALKSAEPAPDAEADSNGDSGGVETEETLDPVHDAIDMLLSPPDAPKEAPPEHRAEDAETATPEDQEPAESPQQDEEHSAAVSTQTLEPDAELAEIFVPEARELLDHTESELLAWERDQQHPEEHRQGLRRHLHTLKGAAASIGLQPFADDVHVLEDFVMSIGEGEIPPSPVVGRLLNCVDTSREFLAILESTGRAEWGVDWNRLLDAAKQEEPEDGGSMDRDFSETQQADEAAEPRPEAVSWRWSGFRPRFPQPRPGGLGSAHAGLSPGSPIPSGALSFLPETGSAGKGEGAQPEVPDEAAEVPPTEPALEGIEHSPARQDTAEPAADPAAPAAGGERAHIWVDAQRMRNLLNNIGELIIDRNRFGKNLSSMNALRSELKQNRARLSDAIAQFRREFEYTNVSKKAAAEASGETRSAGPEAGTERPDGTGNGNGNGKKAELGFEEAFGDFSDIEFDRYDEFNVLARVLEEIVDDIDEIGRSIENTTQRLTDNNAEFSKTSRQLQHELSSLNMMPAHSLFRRLERVFRSALEDSGKTASIHFEGEETMIDRAMLEQLYAPLMHLVRNCVAHGIEPREERLQQDKPPSGQVEVKAFNLSNQVVIEVSDDGAGIREEAVRERGIRDGKLPEDSGELPREKILELLFSSGFSTQRDVTNLAGRGVGLEVVKREVEDLNGALRLAYEPGQYCRWTIQLPLTVSATEAALVEAGGARFAIPLSFVEGGLLLDDEHLRDEGDGQEFYLLDDGQEVPLRNLATLLDLDRHDPAGTQALMLNTGGFRVALRIDRLAGREEIVVKSLGGILGEHPFYSGATLDEEGRPMLILNAPNLAALIRSGETRAAFAGLMRRRTPEARQPAAADPAGTGAETHVLVVDDSLSVRKSLERGLRQIGCEVSLAADGADALDQMRTRLFDLILTDLEMPRMDGFQLITETRDLDMWSGVPIYVVTSRVTEKYRRRAEQLGANGFLSKPVRVEDLERILAKISSR